MSDGDFPDLPVLERLGDSVASAAQRAEAGTGGVRRGLPLRRRGSRRLVRRVPPRVLALAALLVLSTTAAAAAATLLVLRGSVIPAPRATPPEQTPAPGTGRLAGFVVADPRDATTRWTMRLATSRTGLLCSTVGQLVGGEFGIVGLDRRFRTLSPEAADACSLVRTNASSLVGARIFDASRHADVRTVVSGVAGQHLRGVTVAAAGRTQRVAVHAGGTFMAVFAGLPEDLGLDVRLRFADGHLERHPFGIAPMVLPDPAGGRAWRVESGVLGGRPTICISLRAARQRLNAPSSPGACGSLGDNPRRRLGVFFAVRRLEPGMKASYDSPFGGVWRATPPRLLVWGAAGTDVASITVRGPRGERRTGSFFRPNGAFAYMFGPRVRSGQVTVTVRFRDGRTLVRDASTGIVPAPGVERSPP
jgi:hypothetical protein